MLILRQSFNLSVTDDFLTEPDFEQFSFKLLTNVLLCLSLF
jgi:hypothetical protein